MTFIYKALFTPVAALLFIVFLGCCAASVFEAIHSKIYPANKAI